MYLYFVFKRLVLVEYSVGLSFGPPAKQESLYPLGCSKDWTFLLCCQGLFLGSFFDFRMGALANSNRGCVTSARSHLIFISK
jgi:hypothetical protein